jgi:hypothetical protein
MHQWTKEIAEIFRVLGVEQILDMHTDFPVCIRSPDRTNVRADLTWDCVKSFFGGVEVYMVRELLIWRKDGSQVSPPVGF